MKFFASFAAVVLLALALVEAADHHKHHHGKHHVKHHHAKHHLARAEGDCKWKCVDENNKEVTAGISTDNAWAIDLKTKDGNAPFIMIYNPSGVFIIYNETLEILIVFVLNTKTFSICKFKTNATLVINYTMNTAIYAEVADVDVDMKNKAPFKAVQKLVDHITLNLKTFYRPDASRLPNLFNMLNQIKFSQNLVAAEPIATKPEIVANVRTHFGTFLESMKNRLLNGIYDPSIKVLNILIAALGENKGVHKMFRDVIANQYIATDIKGDMTELLRRLTFASYFVGGFLKGDLTNVTVDRTSMTLLGPQVNFKVTHADGAILDLNTNSAAGEIGNTVLASVNQNVGTDYSAMK